MIKKRVSLFSALLFCFGLFAASSVLAASAPVAIKLQPGALPSNLPKNQAIFVYKSVKNPVTQDQKTQPMVWKQVGFLPLTAGDYVFIDPPSKGTTYKLAQAQLDSSDKTVTQWVGLCEFDVSDLGRNGNVSCGNSKTSFLQYKGLVSGLNYASASVTLNDNDTIGIDESKYLPVFYNVNSSTINTNSKTNYFLSHWNLQSKQAQLNYNYAYMDGKYAAGVSYGSTLLGPSAFFSKSIYYGESLDSHVVTQLQTGLNAINGVNIWDQLSFENNKLILTVMNNLYEPWNLMVYPSESSYCEVASNGEGPPHGPVVTMSAISPLLAGDNDAIYSKYYCPSIQNYITQWIPEGTIAKPIPNFRPFGNLFVFSTKSGNYLSWIDGSKDQNYNLILNGKGQKLQSVNSPEKTNGQISYYQYYSPVSNLNTDSLYNQIGLTPTGSTPTINSQSNSLLNLTVAQGPFADFDYATYHGKSGVTTLTISVNNVLGVANASFTGCLSATKDNKCSASTSVASATSALTNGSLSFSFANLLPNSTYYIAVQASRGNSKVLSSVQGPYTTQSPFDGARYSYTASPNSLTVKVKGVQGKGLSDASYTGYLCDTDKCSVTTAVHKMNSTLTNDALSFTFKSLSPGVPYYFFVQEASGSDSVASALQGPYSTLTYKVGPPTNVKLNYISTDRAKSSISWTPGSVSPSSPDVAVTYEINATAPGSNPINCQVSGVSTNSCVVGAHLLGGITYSVTIKMAVTVDGKPYITKTVGPVNIKS